MAKKKTNILKKSLKKFWNKIKKIKPETKRKWKLFFLWVLTIIFFIGIWWGWFQWYKAVDALKDYEKTKTKVTQIMNFYGCKDENILYGIMNNGQVHPLALAKLYAIESQFRFDAVSSCGAKGLGQVMDCNFKPGENAFDIETNIRVSARYFAERIKRFGSLKLALIAYNAGDAVAYNYGKKPLPLETQNYIPKFNKVGDMFGC